jgi:hypothetical protein
MDLNIGFSPLFSVPVLTGLGLVFLVLAGFMIWARQRGASLRGLAFAAILAALFNPTITSVERNPLPGIVTLVVDTSDSAGLAGRPATIDAIRGALEARFSDISRFEVRTITPASGEATDGTRLFEGLARALADVPPEQIAGAVIITDGQVHDVPETLGALGFDAPVHTFIAGSRSERDRRIILGQTPRFGIVGQEQQITFRVSDVGISGIMRARVTTRYDGEIISSRNVTTGDTITLSLKVEHGGANVFQLEVEPLEGELTTANNSVVISLQGIRENLRVLLVSGEPHPGERTWRNLLKSDAAVDLVHFTILRPPEKQDGTPINQLSLIAFPTRELFSVKIDEFDLIIFDRYQRRGVLPSVYFDNIARYVRNGGALLVAAGPEYATPGSLYRTPVAPVLPTQPTGQVIRVPYYPRVTDIGNRHPVTRDLPGANYDPNGENQPEWGRWLRIVEAIPERGQAVMSGPRNTPLLVLSREEEGRVALLHSDQAWLWSRGFEGGGPQITLLRRLSHWLMKEPELAEERLVAAPVGTNLMIERRTMADNVEDVLVTAPDGSTETVKLENAADGIWRGAVAVSGLGVYRVSDSDQSTLAHVGPLNPIELANVTASDRLVGPLVEETGGAVTWVDTVGDSNAGPAFRAPRIVPLRDPRSWAGDGWIGFKRVTASTIVDSYSLSLFAGLLGLALLLGLLSATWFREGR